MIFPDIELARRLERAEGATCAAMTLALTGAGGIRGEVAEIGGGMAAFAGVDSPITQAFGLGLQEPYDASDLDAAEEFFFSRSAPSWLEICPLAHIQLMQELARRGYRPIETSQVFARELTAEDGVPPPVPDGISLRVSPPSESVVWTDVAMRGFFPDGNGPESLRELKIAAGGVPGVLRHLALVEGVIAGASTMYIAGDVAVTNGAATLPEFRRRGIQQALMRARLAAARAAGCKLAMVATMPGTSSQRNVLRAGFGIVYTRTKWELKPQERKHG